MQQKQQLFRGLWLLIVLMTLVIGVRHFDLVKAPNQQFIGNSMDGYRSYMAAMYHIKHDKSYSHYDGMNYPYGDRVDFTDNMPLLTNSLKFISQNIVDLFPYTAGIWNCFLLFSILLSGIFLYLIFRELELPLWYAIPITLGIVFLAPQLIRFRAHFGLAHPFIIPMMIYLLLCFERKKSWQASLSIAVGILLAYSLHSYLFAVSILLIGFYWVMKLLRDLNWKNFKYALFHGGIQVLIPFFILVFMVLLNDSITDRPLKPYGFFDYRAYPLSVFLPLDFEIGTYLKKQWLGPLQHINGEGIAYIGLIPGLFIIVALLRRIWQFREGKILGTALEQHRSFLLSLLGAALILLMLSFGYPISIKGLEYLLNYTGPFQQFRSVGRFAWVFFYVINIITFYILYHWIKHIERKALRIGVLVLIFGILGFESMTSFYHYKYDLYPHPNVRSRFKTQDTPWLETIDWSKFQAILPIPYFHIGSENIWIKTEAPAVQRSLWTSVQTGLPVLSSFMGRTSISQTLNFVALVKEAYRPSPILEEMDPNKSILIFAQKGNFEHKKEQYDYLYKGLPPLFEDKHIALYELPIKVIQQRIADNAKEAIQAFNTLSLHSHGELQTTDSLKTVVYQNFDHTPLERNYAGGGAFSGKPKMEHIIYEGHLPEQKAKSPYLYAMWVFVNEDLQARIWLNLEEYDRSSGQRIWKKGYKIDQHIRAVDGDWALIEMPFQLERTESGLRVTVINHDLFQKEMCIDELLIHPSTTPVFKKEEQWIWRNNRKYEKK